mgnify:CR=1 FL=1
MNKSINTKDFLIFADASCSSFKEIPDFHPKCFATKPFESCSAIYLPAKRLIQRKKPKQNDEKK